MGILGVADLLQEAQDGAAVANVCEEEPPISKEDGDRAGAALDAVKLVALCLTARRLSGGCSWALEQGAVGTLECFDQLSAQPPLATAPALAANALVELGQQLAGHVRACASVLEARFSSTVDATKGLGLCQTPRGLVRRREVVW